MFTGALSAHIGNDGQQSRSHARTLQPRHEYARAQINVRLKKNTIGTRELAQLAPVWEKRFAESRIVLCASFEPAVRVATSKPLCPMMGVRPLAVSYSHPGRELPLEPLRGNKLWAMKRN